MAVHYFLRWIFKTKMLSVLMVMMDRNDTRKVEKDKTAV